MNKSFDDASKGVDDIGCAIAAGTMKLGKIFT
jgi:hypothetical protein